MYRSTKLFSSGRDTGIVLIATTRRTPLRGFWVSSWASFGGPIA